MEGKLSMIDRARSIKAPIRAPIKTLSIVGAGRSGTTVLASILGEVEGIGSAGELRWLWEHGMGRCHRAGHLPLPRDVR
jgi:hypothetical protein